MQRAPAKEDTSDGRRATRREEDLTVIEDLEPGPYEHKAPFDDPHFQKLEPHSGIRLSYVLMYPDIDTSLNLTH